MSVHQITTSKRKVVRTGSAVPAYFLGRRRDAYTEALAAANASAPVYPRAA
jgi:hypothetical protein